jgi:Methyltransferase domain
MDASVLQTIADCLEFRGTDEGYARLSQAYFGSVPLDAAQRLPALGCGTGIEVRALRRRTRPDAAIVGIDPSPAMIDVARRLTADEGLSHNVTYEVGDAHGCRTLTANSTSSRSTRLSAMSMTCSKCSGRPGASSGPAERRRGPWRCADAIGLLSAAVADDWRAFQSRSVQDGTFFGASNYYTYVARRPG